ncbi:hypothetical protein H6P81_019460 [Aristolochia fimbriata]|uniref:F-box domain-containing protein n=1 Tax=Aristolochia fimbriata TaxID=158543 RepID=A0AAV7DRS1_ARIFI|nr:hypothetical protein H6P81_019460 [Aristolochia fimbriata]
MASMEQLNDDVTKNILSRLKLEALIRCKSVSKKWKGLVTEVVESRGEKMHGLIVENYSLAFPGVFLPEYRYESQDSGVFNLDSALDSIHTRGFFCIRDSSDGLLLCSRTHLNPRKDSVMSYFVLNPVTGTRVAVPEAPPMKYSDHRDVLAFDPSSSFFKIVRWSRGSAKSFSEVDFYGSRTGTWSRRRKVAHSREVTFPDSRVSATSTVYVNGVVFRVADPNALVAIDVSGVVSCDDQIDPPARVITVPCLDKTTHRCLGKWQQGKALCYIDYNKTRIKLWVLEEEGVNGGAKEKWVLKQAIRMESLTTTTTTTMMSSGSSFRPVAMHSGKEELVLEVQQGIVCYNLKKSRLEGSYPVLQLKRGYFRSVTVFPFSATFHRPQTAVDP